MGKNKKKNKKKHSTKPAGNRNEATASASTADIQATGFSSHNVTEALAVQISQIPVDNDIKEVADAIVECMIEEVCLRETTGLQGEKLGELSQQNILKVKTIKCKLNQLLNDKDPEYVGRVKKYISLQTKFRMSSILKSSEIKIPLRPETKDEIRKSLELCDLNEVQRKVSEEASGPNLMSLDFQGDERKETGGVDKSVDILKETRDSSINIEKKAEYVPLATHSIKAEKIHNIQNEYGTFESSEPDTERVIESLESKLRDYEDKRRYVELALKTFKEEQSSASSQKEIAAAISKDKLDEATKESKGAAGELNDVIQKLKQFAIDKNLKSTDEIQPLKRSAESVLKSSTYQKYKSAVFQTAGQTPKNVTEENKGAMPKIFESKKVTISPEADDWENCATRVSKAAADQANDLIKELKIVETEKEVYKDDEKFADEVQGATGFSVSAAGFVEEKNLKSTNKIQLVKRSTESVLNRSTYQKYKSGNFHATGKSPKNFSEGNKGAIPKIFKNKKVTKSPETDDWENYATRVSKAAAYQANDLIDELEIVETEKVEKDDEKFTDEGQGATGFSESAAGFTAEKDSLIDTWLNVVFERLTNKQMKEKRLFEKGQKKTNSDESFRRGLKKLVLIQQTTLEKEIKESSLLDSKSKLKFLKDLRRISSEKDGETSTTETKTTAELEGPATEDQEDRRTEFEDKKIRFDYQIDGYRHIKAGKQEFVCSKEDIGNEFKFMDNKVKIGFSDDQIQVGTEKSEFDINIRKLHPAVSKDAAAQPDAAP